MDTCVAAVVGSAAAGSDTELPLVDNALSDGSPARAVRAHAAVTLI